MPNLRPSRGALLRRPNMAPELQSRLSTNSLAAGSYHSSEESFNALTEACSTTIGGAYFVGEDASVVFNSPSSEDVGSTMVLQPRNASKSLAPKRLPKCGSRGNRSKGLTLYQIPTRCSRQGINVLNGVSALAHERSRYCKIKCNRSCQCTVLLLHIIAYYWIWIGLDWIVECTNIRFRWRLSLFLTFSNIFLESEKRRW